MRYDARHLDAVPDGSRVIVTWSGGNGPHEYVVHRWVDYDLYAYSPDRLSDGTEYEVGLLHVLGSAWTLHQITILPIPEKDR